MTDHQKSKALVLRKEGKTLREIGERIGCSAEAVRRYLAKLKFQKYMDGLEDKPKPPTFYMNQSEYDYCISLDVKIKRP